jgi:hypothetical protein
MAWGVLMIGMAPFAYLVMAAMYAYCVWSLGRIARGPEEDTSGDHLKVTRLLRFRSVAAKPASPPATSPSLAADRRASG